MAQLIPENCKKKIDNLGRITLPKGLRDRWLISNDDDMEVFTAVVDNRQCICLSKPVEEKEDGDLVRAIQLLTSNGFEVKTPDNNILLNDLWYLSKKFYKVVEYNYKEDTYFEVKSDGEKKVYNNLKHWVNEFAPVGVREADRASFFEFFDENSENYLKKIEYYRLVDGEWVLVRMEAIEMYDEIMLLIVEKMD